MKHTLAFHAEGKKSKKSFVQTTVEFSILILGKDRELKRAQLKKVSKRKLFLTCVLSRT